VPARRGRDGGALHRGVNSRNRGGAGRAHAAGVRGGGAGRVDRVDGFVAGPARQRAAAATGVLCALGRGVAAVRVPMAVTLWPKITSALAAITVACKGGEVALLWRLEATVAGKACDCRGIVEGAHNESPSATIAR